VFDAVFLVVSIIPTHRGADAADPKTPGGIKRTALQSSTSQAQVNRVNRVYCNTPIDTPHHTVQHVEDALAAPPITWLP
jgi:hypothetical protein